MSQALLDSTAVLAPSAEKQRAKRWIISPAWDLIFLIAAPLAIVPLVSLTTTRWLEVEQLSLIVVAFASLGHHLPGFLRAYGDRDLFGRFRQRFLLAPPCVFVVALFAASLELHGLALILLFWATWHGLMQTYGFMRIYDLKQGSGDKRSAQLDFALCLMIFTAGVLFSDARVYGIADMVDKTGLTIPARQWLIAARWVVGIGAALVLAAYALNLAGRIRRNVSLAWPRLALGFSTGWLYWLGGMLSTDLLLGIATFEIFHALQYDAIAWAYNRGRSRKPDALARPLGALFQQERWASMGLYMALIAAFGAVRFLGETGGNAWPQCILMALLTTSTFLHFYFDGFIWKVSERRTQQDLAIAERPIPARRARSWRPGHTAGWAIAAVLAAGLLTCEALQTSAVDAGEQSQLERLVALTPRLPELQWRVSAAALAAGNTQAAVDSATNALLLRPHSQQAHARLGAALLDSNRFAEAAGEFREAARLAPSRWENPCNLGIALGRVGAWDEAEQAFRRADELQPQNATVQAAWAQLCARRGDQPGAIAHNRAALSIDPADKEIRSDLVSLLSRQAQHIEAIRVAQSGLDLHPADAASQLSLGVAQLDAGSLADAQQNLERAIELDPKSYQANFQLGNLQLARGDQAAASQRYRHCLDLQPDFAPAYINLASVLLLEGNVDHARKAYERALTLAPNDGRAHYNLGLLLWDTRQISPARDHLLRARELGMPLPPALEQQLESVR